MNLEEAIIEGKKLIQIGKLNGRDTQRIEEKVKEIEQRQLEKIETDQRRSIGVQIFSEVLNENIWFCSDEEMVDQIQNDDLGAVCYTANELSKLIDLDPSKEFLKKIHNAKSVFEDSRIIKTKKKEDY